MSSLRLSYASSPESDLEHSPGPPVSSGLTGSGNPNPGRLTKASSDPSVVMPDNSTTDVLPPYQPTYDTRYGFNNQASTEPQLPGSPNTPPNKDPKYLGQNSSQDIPVNMDGQNPYKQSGLYSLSNQDYSKNDYAKELRNEYLKPDAHKRQSSTLHGVFNHVKGHSLSEQSPRRSPKDERMYSTAPDLPPRVDRAVKPMGLISTPTKTPNGRSAHERLFGTKAPQQNDSNEQNNNSENPNFNNKLGSLERSVNSKSDSLSSYDSFKHPAMPNSGLGPNAHDDLKTTLSKIDPDNPATPPKYGQRWDQSNHRHERLGSKLDLKYTLGVSNSNNEHIDQSPRNSHEIDKEQLPMDHLSPRLSAERERQDMYRYSRSPGKQNTPTKAYMETKTDYGKYSRNNSSVQDYSRSSHQDLSQSQLTIHNMPPHHHSPMKNNYHHTNGFDNPALQQNGPPNPYKPVPPPKPKNYKPPYKGQGNYGPNEGMIQPPLPYQHGKSHSNPVQDQRSPTMNQKHDYYYNMASNSMSNNWHTETAIRYNAAMHGPYDMAPPYESHRHTNISYASRSEITPISQRDSAYNMESADVLEGRLPERPNIVDLQGSREQRGSAFELYRKPIHHNLRDQEQYAFYGSHPNIAHNFMNNASTNMQKITPKLSKTQSFNHRKKDGISTPQLFRKLLFGRSKSKESSPKTSKRLAERYNKIDENRITNFNGNIECYGRMQNSRDVTSAIVDSRGAKLVNEYWGVVLDVPQNALPEGKQQEIYFVITDHRLCENAPPLDMENGETLVSPLVMCGPQGTEFLKPVILSIPHYANTLPSLGISLKATDSEKDIHTDWDNILLPSNHTANTVSVKVDHF